MKSTILFRSAHGVVRKNRLRGEGNNTVGRGETTPEVQECSHTTVIKDMCANCGADLRQNEKGNSSEASVPMVHSVPELKVTQQLAQELGQADTERLLRDKKLVLLVDLDQTLIHTTNDNVPNNLKDVYHFQLYGPNSPWYHTRLRPGTPHFLSRMAPFFELHICTFGARNYAHMIATFLDENGKYFSHRILSRDECFNATSKTDNLKALFPCGDSMVCIIDDREDVWNMAANLIQVKPYHFFQHTGDINAPPGLDKHELDGKGVDFNELQNQIHRKQEEKTVESPEKGDDDESKGKKVDHTEISEEKTKEDEAEETSVKGKNQEKPQKEEEQEKSDGEDRKEERIEEKVEEKIAEKSEKKSDEKEKEEATKEEESTTDEKEENPKTDESSPSQVKSREGSTCPEEIKEDPQKGNMRKTSTSETEDNLIEIEDPDDYLLYLENILLKIHRRFYELYEKTGEIPDLKVLIPRIRSEVLVGKNIVFSGLVPNRMRLEHSKAFQIARSLGANVTQDLTRDSTHLVAAASGTQKVIVARKRADVQIVSPDWLWSCAERWEHVDERVFPLDPNNPSKMRQPPPHCHSPEHVVSYGDRADTSSESSEPKFMDTINPLLSFSKSDLAEMNKEFDQFFDSDADSSSSDESVDIENPPENKNVRKRRRQEEEEKRKRMEEEKLRIAFEANEESVDKTENSSEDDDEMPSTKFRRGEDLPSDLDIGSNNGSEGSENPLDDEDDGDWNMMGAALEREFLGLD
ncbi:RNA polymerase II subunit A C-terminal domain phosphatase [Lutzomyia longipalpis]|uniref:RNA polymerase II subunit A C-terminal domain phosphatase n=1 Tax=Lutzomyia longipalpis TaxID=7200 RepID=UPI002483611A|nr:RNA polymerase II subunit A C-terminal domain phosphatase [Lutzomyia longipalpis]